MTADDYPIGYWLGEGSNYDDVYKDDPGWRGTLEVMKAYCPPPATLYEMGAAMGFFVFRARLAGYESHGIDISPHAVRQAPGPIRPFLILGNAVNSPYGSSSADIVATWEFLEHVPEDELPDMLDEIERVIRPRGWTWHRIGMDDSDSTHYTIQQRDWWEALFADRGWVNQPEAEASLDDAHADRDWAGRFFVWSLP